MRAQRKEFVTVTVTPRQFSLIRVACLQRLTLLKTRIEGCNPFDADEVATCRGLKLSYDETRAMMERNGVLDPYRVGRDPVNNVEPANA